MTAAVELYLAVCGGSPELTALHSGALRSPPSKLSRPEDETSSMTQVTLTRKEMRRPFCELPWDRGHQRQGGPIITICQVDGQVPHRVPTETIAQIFP